MKFKIEYITVFAIMVTEVLGFSMILPFLPLFAETLGMTKFWIGFLLMTFSFFQFWSSPILGRMSDSFGRKPLLLFSQLSTFISFIILGFANSIWMLFLSRAVDGILGSNMSIAQAYLTDMSDKNNRSKVLGLSGMAFGFGFLIGPAIGGYLATLTPLGYRLPGFVAAGISLVTIFTTIFFLPETIKEKKKFRITSKLFHFGDFIKYFSEKKTSIRLYQFFTYALTHAIYVSMFSLFAKYQLGFGPQQIGFFMTYIGVVSIVIRGGIFLVPRDKERTIRRIAPFLIVIGLVTAAFSKTTLHIMIAGGFFSVGAGFTRTLMMGSISRKVNDSEQGAIMGVASSLGSISQIIGPFVGGILIENFIPGIIPLAAAVVMSVGIILMFKENKHKNI